MLSSGLENISANMKNRTGVTKEDALEQRDLPLSMTLIGTRRVFTRADLTAAKQRRFNARPRTAKHPTRSGLVMIISSSMS
jgi:hypothetical protein